MRAIGQYLFRRRVDEPAAVPRDFSLLLVATSHSLSLNRHRDKLNSGASIDLSDQGSLERQEEKEACRKRDLKACFFKDSGKIYARYYWPST